MPTKHAQLPPDDDKDTVDYRNTEANPLAGYTPLPPPGRRDRYKAGRAAIARIMHELEKFYVLVMPLLKRCSKEEAGPIMAQFFALHEAMGRLKIAMTQKG